MSDALDSVEQIYFSMQLNLNDTLAACPSQAERDQVMSAYVAARQNYWDCVKKAFHDDDPAVQALVVQADASIDSLTKINEHLGDIARVINDLNQAVMIGEKIAAKVLTVA